MHSVDAKKNYPPIVKGKTIIPSDFSDQYKPFVHYTEDYTLSKQAIEVMAVIEHNTKNHTYTTNQDLKALPLGAQAISTAKKQLEIAGYISCEILSRNRRGWIALKPYRQREEMLLKLSPQYGQYAYLPKDSEYGGFTYVFRRIRDGIYKIGSTTDLKSRASAIAANCGSHLEFVIALDICISLTIELNLHDFFEHKRTVGEWFELDKFDIEQIEMLFNTLMVVGVPINSKEVM